MMSGVQGELSPDEVALEAFLYYYPLVVMEVTRRQLCANALENGIDLVANPLLHNRHLANAKWRSVARTNVDTLISSCWLDMGNGPAEMSIAPTQSRFFMYQVLDMWSDTFAVLGSRTLGNNGLTVRFVPSESPQDESEGVGRGDTFQQIRTPTRFSWIIGRTYTSNTKDDLVAARLHQAGVAVEYEETPHTPYDADPFLGGEAPVEVVDALSASEFFERADGLHKREGSHGTDWSLRLRLPMVGLGNEQTFRFGQQSAAIQRSLSEAFSEGKELTKDRDSVSSSAGNWQQFHSAIGVYGNDYLRRAIIARYGLAANPREDAVYISTSRDSRGLALSGNENYHLRFAAGQLPPAKFFWSLTAYDEQGQLVENRWNKYCVSSRDALQFSPDGSLAIFIGPTLLKSVSASNWIPTQSTLVTLTLRLYGPSSAVLSGRWLPPPVFYELEAI